MRKGVCGPMAIRAKLLLSPVLALCFKKVKMLIVQSCRTLCQPMDCSPPGSSVHGILGWVASFPSPGDLPDPWSKPGSSALQADSLPSELQGGSNNNDDNYHF